MKNIKTIYILVPILLFGVILAATSVNRDIMIGDEGNHAAAGMLIYDVSGAWLANPFMSLSELKELAISHHAHYKSFASFMTYTPLHHLFLGLIYVLLGTSRTTTMLPTIIESMVLIFFVYRLSLLSYRNEKMAFLAAFFLAFTPMYFFSSTRVMLEIGAMMFMVMSVYYFSLYLMKKNGKYMYIAAMTVALSLLIKPSMILVVPILVLAYLWNRWPSVLPALRKDAKTVIIAVIIFFVVMAPWILGFLFMHGQGLSGSFINKWFMHAGGYEIKDVDGFPLTDGSLFYHAGLPFYKTIVFHISSVFYHWYLAPFYLLAIWHVIKNIRRLNDVERLSVLSILVVAGYLTWISLAGIRYILPIFPFVSILAAKPLYEVVRKAGAFRCYLMAAIMVLAVAQCSFFLTNITDVYGMSDFDRASIFVIDDASVPTTVVSTLYRSQTFSFSLLDKNRETYSFYLPGNRDTLNEMLSGNYSEPEWESFGISYPPIGYVIVHEGYDKKVNTDYSLMGLMECREDFELAEIIQGKFPNTRAFIYKRK